jgi:hypothetical protein
MPGIVDNEDKDVEVEAEVEVNAEFVVQSILSGPIDKWVYSAKTKDSLPIEFDESTAIEFVEAENNSDSNSDTAADFDSERASDGVDPSVVAGADAINEVEVKAEVGVEFEVSVEVDDEFLEPLYCETGALPSSSTFSVPWVLSLWLLMVALPAVLLVVVPGATVIQAVPDGQAGNTAGQTDTHDDSDDDAADCDDSADADE